MDFPPDADERQMAALETDPLSRFYARQRPRTLALPRLLPYAVEKPADRAKFLAHIVSHLYISIKTLDLQGLIAVSAKDLAQLRGVQGLLDIDLALETNLFELTQQDSASPELQDDLDDDLEPPGALDDDMAGMDDDSAEDDDDDDDMDAKTAPGDCTSQHKRSPRSAATVLLRVWTHELLVWLKMKYDMPVSLRKALAAVYYAVCCSRGQHLALKIYVRTFETLTKPVDLLRDSRLKLPWDPIHAELSLHFPSPDAVHEPLEKKELALLLKVAERASNFFDPEALPVLFRHLASHFSIPNAAMVLWCMRVLPQTFTEDSTADTDIRNYIPAFLYMWKKLSKSKGVDSHLTSILGRLSTAHLQHIALHPTAAPDFSEFGVYTRDQFTYVVNTLLNSLSINCGKFGSMRTKYFHGFASIIVFSMNGDLPLAENGILDLLETLLNATKSFIHPSNTGEWSKPISKLISSLIHQFFKRYNMEREPHGALDSLPAANKLLDAVVKRFVNMVLPLVRTGLQSKKNSVVEEFLTVLGCLAHMDAESTLGYMLHDIYESLQGVIATHRVITALRCMEALTRYFAATPVYRVHLPIILELMLPGVDSNDLTKTIHTLDAFATVANFVPLHDISHGSGEPGLAIELTTQHVEYLKRNYYTHETQEPFDVEKDLEIQALESSSSVLKYLIKSLAQRLFVLFDNIPDPSKSTGIEKYLCEMLPKLVYMMLESMSDDIFIAFREEFVTFVSDHTIHYVAEMIGEVCGALIKRDPAYFNTWAPVLIKRINEEVRNGAGKSKSGIDIMPRDQNLYWNVMILSSCVGNAGEFIVDQGDNLRVVSFYLMKNVKGTVSFASTRLLNQVLLGLTKIRLKETRLISPKYEKPVDEKCWGGFQFDKHRFDQENLDFEWFVPGEREVAFAGEFFKSHITKALSNILVSLKQISHKAKKEKQSETDISDELRSSFLYLGYGISGISYLLDPSFDEDIPKLSEHKYETLQNRLTLLAQIRAMQTDKSSDENLVVDNIHDYLQDIVEDIERDVSQDIDLEAAAKLDQEIIEKMGHASAMQSSESLSDPDELLHKEHILSRFSESSVLNSPAFGSPKLEGLDMSLMNPAIIFRERKIYTSRYYFGDDIETRKSHSLYLQIHRMRHLVGKSLHYIFRYMQSNLLDNTKLFKNLLYVLNIWFSDVGRERLLDHSHARVSLNYVTELQHVTRMRKPFTRLAFGSRIESYHLLRVALHATLRTMTPLDRTLVEDIVKMSCSTYLSIADSAQSSLVSVMKRVNGSYSVIVRACLRHVNKAVEEGKPKSIESGLRVLEIKRIKSKLQSDYSNLQNYVALLHKCLEIDDKDVVEIAQISYKGLSGNVGPAPKICLIDHALVDLIRPPDEFMDLEIKAVYLAKEKKRKIYLRKLQDVVQDVIEHGRLHSHWKTTSLDYSFLMESQADLEMPSNGDVMDLLVKGARLDHPIISKTAIKGITKILNKFQMRSEYRHQMEEMYKPFALSTNLDVIDTKPVDGVSYYEAWKEELNTSNPNYYIDHRMSKGWLFWDESALVVKKDAAFDLTLTDEDSSVLDIFCRNVSKNWFFDIVNLWVAENDANLSFQGCDVFITAEIVALISIGRITSMSMADIYEIIGSVFESDEKSTHIVVCELITGILIALRAMNTLLLNERDDYLVPFLSSVFERYLTSDSIPVWNIFTWWTPAHIDSRRFPKIRDLFLKLRIHGDSEPAYTTTMLTYAKSFVSSITWHVPEPNKILETCFDNVLNRYEAVREQIAMLIVVTSFTYYGDSFASMGDFIEASRGDHDSLMRRSLDPGLSNQIIKLFETTAAYRKEAETMTVSEVLKSDYIRCATTILTWLKQLFNTSISAQYQPIITSHVVPFLLDLISWREVCVLSNIDPLSSLKRVSQVLFGDECLDEVINMVTTYSKSALSTVQLLILSEFIEVIFFKNMFTMTREQRKSVLDVTVSLLYHEKLEVREAFASTFSGLIHLAPPSEVDHILAEYNKKFSAQLSKYRKTHKLVTSKALKNEDVVLLHGATLGLGAAIHAFSFLSPPPQWVPAMLSTIASKASGIPGVVGKSAKEILGKFKKTRQDTWHIDSNVFTEEQMQDLEGVLWRSYYI